MTGTAVSAAPLLPEFYLTEDSIVFQFEHGELYNAISKVFIPLSNHLKL